LISTSLKQPAGYELDGAFASCDLGFVSVPRRPVGFLPAAGRGVRFGSSGYAKELFPLLFEEGAVLEPRPIGELALQAIQKTGAKRCVTVISPDKVEVVRVLGGSESGMPLAYVVQPEPGGIPQALACARPWLEGDDVVFAMPDTIFLPGDALARVHEARVATGADVMLGLFPTDEPERLAPVEQDASGAIVRIHDKPAHAPVRNTWGIASWSPRFTAFCCDWDAARDESSEGAIGHAFEAARAAGLDVRAMSFAAGRFLDIGTPRGLRAALSALVTHGVLVPDQATVAKGQ
jgi:glucose-1-phosphate thymidylyltransferase